MLGMFEEHSYVFGKHNFTEVYFPMIYSYFLVSIGDWLLDLPCRFNMDLVVLIVFIEKNPCVSRPTQFKLMLFKGHPYLLLPSS